MEGDPHSEGPATGRSPKARRWLITSFNYGSHEDLPNKFTPLDAHIRYVCWGAETCPETGRNHVHYYIRFDSPTTRGVCQSLVGDATANCIVCKGSDQDNHNYVFKDDSRLLGPWEHGKMLAGDHNQGKRSDLDELVDGIKSGLSDTQLCDQFPKAMLRYSSHVARFRSITDQPIEREIETLVCVGPTGIGKSHWAHKIPNIFPVTLRASGELRFDGYTGEDAILIEEFTGQCPIEFLLRILDKWPLRIDVKFSNIAARWTKVWISSNTHPNNWYPMAGDRHREALLRRLTHIVEAETREELESKLNTLADTQ